MATIMAERRKQMNRQLTRRPTFAPFFSNEGPDFDQLMAGFFRPINASNELSDWRPAADVRETEDAFIVEAELPGLKKEDVSVTFEDGTLTLSGERKFEEETNGSNLRRVERSYGAFSRSFRLPREIDAEGVTANFRDGILTINVPKTETAKPRSIEIS